MKKSFDNLKSNEQFLDNFKAQYQDLLENVENLIKTKAHLEEEAMEVFAEKEALEDLGTWMDEALKKKLVTLEVYTQTIRENNREIYKKKYLLRKIQLKREDFLKTVAEMKTKAGL